MDLKSVQQAAQYSAGSQQVNIQNSIDAQSQSAVAREAEVTASAALQAQRAPQSVQQEQRDTVQLKSSMVKNLDAVKAIEQMHSRLNDLVKGVRQSNEELNKAAEQVSQMQSGLMTIVKNFPPYPIESQERRDLLMSYMSLRKEIESMMVPPPPQPVYEKVKSMWEALFAQNGQMQASAIPDLDAGSGDKLVQVAAETLQQTGKQLSALSDGVTQALLQP